MQRIKEQRSVARVTMAYYAKLYLVTAISFLVLDVIWLGFIARAFYQANLGVFLSPAPDWCAAILFYLLFIAGILLFVVLPNRYYQSPKRVVVYGAVFGLVTYGTYGLTNLALIENWPVIVTFVDLAWGTTVSASVSYAGFFADRWLL